MTVENIGPMGRTTVPNDARDPLRLEPGDGLKFIVHGDGTAVMVPAKLTLTDLKGCLPPPKRALDSKELDAAVGAALIERACQIGKS